MLVNFSGVLRGDIKNALNEPIKKINTIKRLSRKSCENLSESLDKNYLDTVRKYLPDYPIVLIDDTDIIKPYGEKFESLGTVRDGSSKNNTYEKGYFVTEMVGLTKNEKQPISLYSHIHSSHEKKYRSTNHIMYQGLDKIIKELGRKACFVLDSGFDMNNLYTYIHKNNQDYIVRITSNRKIFHKGKWYKSTVLRNARKGKIKTTLKFKNESIDCYINHLNVKLTSSKMSVRLVLVYGLGENPMMLITNRTINSKEDVIDVVRTYMSRWRIEEYFRFKKQEYGFENMRVRSLKAMNNINKMLSYTIAFAGILTERMDKKLLSIKVILRARALRDKVQFYYYQMSKGIQDMLKFAKCGIQEYLQIERRNTHKQLCFFKC